MFEVPRLKEQDLCCDQDDLEHERTIVSPKHVSTEVMTSGVHLQSSGCGGLEIILLFSNKPSSISRVSAFDSFVFEMFLHHATLLSVSLAKLSFLLLVKLKNIFEATHIVSLFQDIPASLIDFNCKVVAHTFRKRRHHVGFQQFFSFRLKGGHRLKNITTLVSLNCSFSTLSTKPPTFSAAPIPLNALENCHCHVLSRSHNHSTP